MLMLTMFLFQVAEGPQNVITLQWVVITALAGVCITLFRMLQKANEANSESQTRLLERTLIAVQEINNAIGGLANAIEVIQQQFSISREIERLRRDLQNDSKKD